MEIMASSKSVNRVAPLEVLDAVRSTKIEPRAPEKIAGVHAEALPLGDPAIR